MAWVEPVTDRQDGSAVMTYTDMNRITGNLKWLYDTCVANSITVSGSAISKTIWTQNDIITATFWAELLTCLANVCSAVGYTPTNAPNDQMLFDNINQIETIELACETILANYATQGRMNHYVGDKIGNAHLYAGDPFNAGGRYE